MLPKCCWFVEINTIIIFLARTKDKSSKSRECVKENVVIICIFDLLLLLPSILLEKIIRI